MMQRDLDILGVKIAMQGALLEKITPSLRAVCLDCAARGLHVRAIFDGEVDDESAELIGIAETELMAATPQYEDRYVLEIVRWDAPQSLAEVQVGDWVFRRAEPAPDTSAPNSTIERWSRKAWRPTTRGAAGGQGGWKDSAQLVHRRRLLVSVQRALLEQITPGLRELVADDLQGPELSLIAVFECGALESELLQMDEFGRRLASACPDLGIEIRIEHLDPPQRCTHGPNAEALYARFEGW